MENETTNVEIHKASVEKPWLKNYTEEAIHGELPQLTIYEYLWENNKKHQNRVALNYFDRKITYGELFYNIDRVSASLLESGVKKGDIVTIAMPSTPEAIYLFYALSKIGAISNMVDPRSSKEELEHYAAEVDSKLLFTIDVAAKKFEEIKKKSSVKEVVVVSPADSMPLGISLGYAAKTFFESAQAKIKESKVKSGLNIHITIDKNKINPTKIKLSCFGKTIAKASFDRVKNQDGVIFENTLEIVKEEPIGIKWQEFFDRGKSLLRINESEPYEPNKPVVIVHTGGTTGVPKGVLLSNDNINIATYDCMHAGFDFQREDKWLNIMPPFIAYGVGNGLHLPLVKGMEVILIPQFNPEEFDKLLCKYHPNHMTGVPSHYRSLLHSKRMENKDLSYWKSAIVGGDGMKVSLEEDVNKFLKDHKCPFTIKKGYGMSEVMAAVVACPSNECNAIGSVGIPFPHSIIGIFDPDTDEELGYGELGEIRIQTPNMMLGYYNNPEEEEKIVKTHKDGTVWVHSGDLGYMTEEGLLFIEGRIKNMIIRNDGFKVYPKRIEDTIMTHPFVEACMVVGIDDLAYAQGKLPKAYVTLKEGISEQNIEAELKILCKKLLPEYSQPVEFEVRDSFPVTKIGKFDYHALEVEALEKQKASITKETKVYQYK